MDAMKNSKPILNVGLLEEFKPGEIQELCKSTEEAITAGIGFSWINPPPRIELEKYWKGVLLVPSRSLLIGKLDGVVAGSLQLVFPLKSNESSAFSASIDTHFVAPWARGNGLAKMLLESGEELARIKGYSQILLEVREKQEIAISVYELGGYIRWGKLPTYHKIGEQKIAGYFYYKNLVKNKDKIK